MKFSFLLYSVVFAGLLGGCGIQIKPLKTILNENIVKKTVLDTNVVYRFFDEDYVGEGFEYHYPDETSKVFVPEGSGRNGEVAIEMDLDPDDYSGGAIAFENMRYDMSKIYSRGALEFWIKGNNGGENCFVELADEEVSDGVKVEVRLPLSDYTDVTTGWSHVSIPLADFGRRGVYWDEKKQLEVPKYFDWDKVTEFLITIEKGRNKEFKIWLDDIYVVKDVYPPADTNEIYWDELKEVVPVPPLGKTPKVKSVATIFKDELPVGGYGDVYGGKTAFKTQPTTDTATDAKVMAMYLDNLDYSGVTFDFSKNNTMDLSKIRDNKGGIGFWAKFGPRVEQVYFGILGENSAKRLVQVTLSLADFAKPDTSWQYYMIPLKSFGDQGAWWNEKTQSEVPGDMGWNKVKQITFLVDKYGNRLEDGVPVTVYLDNITVLESIPGYVDPDEYWDNFSSNAKDLKLFNFEKPEDERWTADAGEQSDAFVKVKDSDDRDKFGRKWLYAEYSLYDWCAISFSFYKNSSPDSLRDWSKHNALKFDFYTRKDSETVTIQIGDAGKEVWFAQQPCTYGWHTYTVPLRKFRKDPYDQVPDAEQNNRFDLNSVSSISINPTKNGTMGFYRIDNIVLTNIDDKKK